MNERIKELWEQCKTPDWHQDNPTYDHEKFAELIVRECMSYMEDGDIDFAKFMIRKHFGVEE